MYDTKFIDILFPTTYYMLADMMPIPHFCSSRWTHMDRSGMQFFCSRIKILGEKIQALINCHPFTGKNKRNTLLYVFQ